MRILTDTDISIESPVFVGADRETPADTVSMPVCTVTREDGTALAAATVASGDIDQSLTPNAGHYFARLTAATHLTQVDDLTLNWSATAGGNLQTYRTTVSVVRAHYVTVPEIRAFPGMDSTDYSRSQLEDIRDDLEDYIERITGIAWTPRYHRDIFDGQWSRSVSLSKQNVRTLLAVKVGFGSAPTAQTLANFDIVKDPAFENDSIVTWRSNWLPAPTVSSGRNNITVAYEYGLAAPPTKLKRELIKAIKSEAASQNTNESFRQVSSTVDGITYRYNTPNPWMGRPTGEMTLDPVLDEFKDRWVMA